MPGAGIISWSLTWFSTDSDIWMLSLTFDQARPRSAADTHRNDTTGSATSSAAAELGSICPFLPPREKFDLTLPAGNAPTRLVRGEALEFLRYTARREGNLPGHLRESHRSPYAALRRRRDLLRRPQPRISCCREVVSGFPRSLGLQQAQSLLVLRGLDRGVSYLWSRSSLRRDVQLPVDIKFSRRAPREYMPCTSSDKWTSATRLPQA